MANNGGQNHKKRQNRTPSISKWRALIAELLREKGELSVEKIVQATKVPYYSAEKVLLDLLAKKYLCRERKGFYYFPGYKHGNPKEDDQAMVPLEFVNEWFSLGWKEVNRTNNDMVLVEYTTPWITQHQRIIHSDSLRDLLIRFEEELPYFISNSPYAITEVRLIETSGNYERSKFDGILECEQDSLFDDIRYHCPDVIKLWEKVKEGIKSHNEKVETDVSNIENSKKELEEILNSLVEKIQYYRNKPVLDGDCEYLLQRNVLLDL